MADSPLETLNERLQRRSAAVATRRVRRVVGWCVTLVLVAVVFAWAFIFGIEILAQLPRLLAVLS